MRYLLSIKTVYPKPGGKVWYDDQRQVHRQIFQGDETIDYAFMGQHPDAADNRWLREAYERRVPVIHFLGIAPGRYRAMLPTFISGWDAGALKAQVTFGLPDRPALEPPDPALERRYVPSGRQATTSSGIIPHGRHNRLQRSLRTVWTA
jgi:putative restriction endonuclease